MPFVDFLHNSNSARWVQIVQILGDAASQGQIFDERVVRKVLETEGQKWDVAGLAKYLRESEDAPGANSSLTALPGTYLPPFPMPASIVKAQILPRMAQLAIQLPALLPEVFPLLLAGRNGSLTFSQKQLACILANAFFGTLPDQKLQFRENGKSMRMFPQCDFRVLFQEWMYNSVTKAKLDGIFEYFHRVLDRPGWESSKVTFTRRCLSEHEFPDWDNLDTKFYDLKAQSSGRIEDDGVGCLQVDFANEIIGGGVLSQGAVQEEILFIIYPEMLASLLFSQQMMDNEAVFITGPERFSTYTGYAASFKIAGRFNDSTPFDSKGRRKTEFVAMDATYFRRKARKSQFGKDSMVRELNKAYTSFLFSYQSSLSGDASIATGNWGCGAFNGDLELKAVIQLLAASAARRNLIYFTFGDEDLSVKLATLSQMLLASKLTAGRLFHLVISFNDTRQENSSLLEFLITTIIEQ